MIGAGGTISDRGDGGEGAARQAQRLRQGEYVKKSKRMSQSIDFVISLEGVTVSESGAPLRFRVNMQQYGWCEFDRSLGNPNEFV